MAHRELYLFVQAEDTTEAAELAGSFVQDVLEYEHTFFDAYHVLSQSVCSLDSKQDELRNLQTRYNPLQMAAELLAKAETSKSQQDFETAGYYYCRAGELFQTILTDDIPFYNVSLRNYDLPANPASWFLVPVDFHC